MVNVQDSHLSIILHVQPLAQGPTNKNSMQDFLMAKIYTVWDTLPYYMYMYMIYSNTSHGYYYFQPCWGAANNTVESRDYAPPRA